MDMRQTLAIVVYSGCVLWLVVNIACELWLAVRKGQKTRSLQRTHDLAYTEHRVVSLADRAAKRRMEIEP
jgi:hypothetical protein